MIYHLLLFLHIVDYADPQNTYFNKYVWFMGWIKKHIIILMLLIKEVIPEAVNIEKLKINDKNSNNRR